MVISVIMNDWPLLCFVTELGPSETRDSQDNCMNGRWTALSSTVKVILSFIVWIMNSSIWNLQQASCSFAHIILELFLIYLLKNIHSLVSVMILTRLMWIVNGDGEMETAVMVWCCIKSSLDNNIGPIILISCIFPNWWLLINWDGCWIIIKEGLTMKWGVLWCVQSQLGLMLIICCITKD